MVFPVRYFQFSFVTILQAEVMELMVGTSVENKVASAIFSVLRLYQELLNCHEFLLII